MNSTPRTDAEYLSLDEMDHMSDEDRIIAMRDFARQLERELAEASKMLYRLARPFFPSEGATIQDENTRLRAEIELLRKDKARLKSVLILANMALDTADAHLFSDEGNGLACQEIEAARAAIDAAMEGDK
jgi:hypothetical protein